MYNLTIAEAEATLLQGMPGAEQFFKLGMMSSTGQSVPLDMVSAHKWFNIAATLGMKDAVRLRNEIAAEMSDHEIATAQRAARQPAPDRAGVGGVGVSPGRTAASFARADARL